MITGVHERVCMWCPTSGTRHKVMQRKPLHFPHGCSVWCQIFVASRDIACIAAWNYMLPIMKIYWYRWLLYCSSTFNSVSVTRWVLFDSQNRKQKQAAMDLHMSPQTSLTTKWEQTCAQVTDNQVYCLIIPANFVIFNALSRTKPFLSNVHIIVYLSITTQTLVYQTSNNCPNPNTCSSNLCPLYWPQPLFVELPSTILTPILVCRTSLPTILTSVLVCRPSVNNTDRSSYL